MGKLALWGAIEGLGKGLSRGAEMRYEEEKATTADRRGMRLEHFKQQEMTARIKLTEGGATTRHAETIRAQEDTAAATRELKTTMAQALFTQQSTLLEEKYGFDTKLEELKQQGRFDVAALTSISSSSQWEFGEYTQQDRHPKTGSLIENVVKTSSDKVTGITFDQHGDIMVANGMPLRVAEQRFPGHGRDPKTGDYLLDDEERKKAVTAANKYILAHPQDRSKFMQEFGYLPIAFFQEHGNLVRTKITAGMRESTKLPRTKVADAVSPTVEEPGEEVPQEVAARMDQAGFGAGGAPPRAPGALERAAAAEAAPLGPPGAAPGAAPAPLPAAPTEAPVAPVTGAVAPPGQPAAPPTPPPDPTPPPITVGIQRGRAGEPGTVAGEFAAIGRGVRGRTAEAQREIEVTRGSAEKLREGIVAGFKRPGAAIEIANNAVKTGNIPRREDFEMLKRSWLTVKPYLTDEVIVALEPILQKGGQGGGGSPAVTEG